jgi:hypothetical protein
MARKVQDPAEATTVVNVADFQRTRDSVSLLLVLQNEYACALCFLLFASGSTRSVLQHRHSTAALPRILANNNAHSHSFSKPYHVHT